MKIRCVVTGQTATGTSIFVRDTAVDPIALTALPGFQFHRLWGGDAVPQLPCDSGAAVPASYAHGERLPLRVLHHTCELRAAGRSA